MDAKNFGGIIVAKESNEILLSPHSPVPFYENLEKYRLCGYNDGGGGNEMKIGDLVEDFALPGTGGEFRLSEMRGRAVILFFYPKDDTPGCTIEGGEFSALADEFANTGAVVVGVSRDSVRSHEKFRAKFNYAHHLISDAEELLCARFGVMKNKTMFGKPARGVSRSTFLIDKDGRLAREWRDIKNAEGHAAEVLDAVRELPR